VERVSGPPEAILEQESPVHDVNFNILMALAAGRAIGLSPLKAQVQASLRHYGTRNQSPVRSHGVHLLNELAAAPGICCCSGVG
jgi:hypothetical protein